METGNRVQQQTDSIVLHKNIGDRITETEGVKRLSLYEDEILSPEVWAEGIKRIKKAFPRLEDNWHDEMTSRVKELKFTNSRFIDAIDRMIDECKYPEPAIAEIIRFDKQVNLLTHDQVAKEGVGFGSTIWNYYTLCDIDGSPMYVLDRDLKVYGLEFKKWIPKQPASDRNIYKNEEEIKKNKVFSLVDEWNKLVDESKIGQIINKNN